MQGGEKKRMKTGAGGAPAPPAPPQSEPSVYRTLYMTLFQIWDDLHRRDTSFDRSTVEVEARVGMLVQGDHRWQHHQPETCVGQKYLGDPKCLACSEEQRRQVGVEFRAGLDEVMVESLERSFPEDVYTKSVAPPSRVRTSDGGARFTVDGAGQMIAAEVKTAVLKTNVALLAHHYDMRLCCATEQPTATTAGAGAGAGVDTWTMERLKKRTTYRRRHDPMWQVDVTEVETFTRAEVEGRCGSGGSSSSSSSSSSGGGGGGGSTDYELEFEMEAAAMKAWLTADPAQAPAHTQRVARSLYDTIQGCVPCHKDAPRTQELPPLPNAADIKAKVLDMMWKIRRTLDPQSTGTGIPNPKSDMYNKFIGSMSLPLNYTELKNVHRKPYFVTEKSDGTRMLLTVVDTASGPLAVVMDRGMHVSPLLGGSDIGKALGVGTVLDGELVLNRVEQRRVYLAFDALAVQGIVQAQLPFHKRLEAAGQCVDRFMGAFSHMRDPKSKLAPLEVTPLVKKQFVDKRLLAQVLARIKPMEGTRVYHDPPSRSHLTDGLIFQPDAPYKIGTDDTLLKWKWPDVRSVDMAVHLPASAGGAILLMCTGPDSMEIDATRRGSGHIGMGRFDELRLRADIAGRALKGPTSHAPPIAEVAYNPRIGRYCYMHLRSDKVSPNALTVVMGVLSEQAENISAEELEYRLLARSEAPAENDFDAQVTKMLRSALKYQRTRTSAPLPPGGV